MMLARGRRAPHYTPHQRRLSERLQSALPDLQADVAAAARGDEVLVLDFLDDGDSPIGVVDVRRVPRAKLAGLGDSRFDRPAPTELGEAGACWILARQDGTPGSICVRLGRRTMVPGGSA